jgi:pimeloyl-ACP methyl ester carboxylesterase
MSYANSADGTTIAYDRSGSGPPVVLVGGAFGDRREATVAGLVEVLSPQFTVYNYDRRGRGESGDTQPYALQREIDDVASIIDVAGSGAMVFGGSSGGALALECVAAGLPISKLAVFEPPYVTDPASPPLPSEAELRELVVAGRRGDAVELFLTKGAEMTSEAVAQLKASPFWPEVEAVAHTLAYEAAVVGAGPVPVERFAVISVPTLVLYGTKSSRRMQDAARAVADTVHQARLQPLEGQAHGDVDGSLGAALSAFFE